MSDKHVFFAVKWWKWVKSYMIFQDVNEFMFWHDAYYFHHSYDSWKILKSELITYSSHSWNKIISHLSLHSFNHTPRRHFAIYSCGWLWQEAIKLFIMTAAADTVADILHNTWETNQTQIPTYLFALQWYANKIILFLYYFSKLKCIKDY